MAIPQTVKVVFGRAIEARQGVSISFPHDAIGNEDVESQKKHQHFINVLKDIADILWPFKPAPRQKGARSGHASTVDKLAAEQFANRFSRLSVEEMTQADSSGQPAPDQSLPEVPMVVVERSQDEVEEEFLFAINALLQELQNIRAYVDNAWTSYKQRQLDLVTVSLVTNTSIDLVRRLSCRSRIQYNGLRGMQSPTFRYGPSQHCGTVSKPRILRRAIWKKRRSLSSLPNMCLGST